MGAQWIPNLITCQTSSTTEVQDVEATVIDNRPYVAVATDGGRHSDNENKQHRSHFLNSSKVGQSIRVKKTTIAGRRLLLCGAEYQRFELRLYSYYLNYNDSYRTTYSSMGDIAYQGGWSDSRGYSIVVADVQATSGTSAAASWRQFALYRAIAQGLHRLMSGREMKV